MHTLGNIKESMKKSTETTFTIRIDKQLKADFVKMCKERDVNASQLMRAFIRDKVKGYKENKE